MARPPVLILRTAGTNCDEETEFAWERAGAQPQRVHIRRLIERPDVLREFAALCLPGGFSYGDDIASGKILANQLALHLRPAIDALRARGGLVLGICNGFQALVKAGLLPGAGLPRVTLTQNDSGRFEARWVRLRAESSRCPFLEPGEEFLLPVAHGEGKLLLDGGADPSAAERGHTALRSAGCTPLRYVQPDRAGAGYPSNPNGSQFDLAGLCDPSGRVFGLMPHPERCVQPEQHPDRTRVPSIDTAGLRLFERAVACLRRDSV